jgi:hypothetical protein
MSESYCDLKAHHKHVDRVYGDDHASAVIVGTVPASTVMRGKRQFKVPRSTRSLTDDEVSGWIAELAS